MIFPITHNLSYNMLYINDFLFIIIISLTSIS